MSEINIFLESIGTWLPLMTLGVIIICAIRLTPALAKLGFMMLFGVKIEFRGIEEGERNKYLADAHIVSDTLGRDLLRYTRLIVTPSRTYYLIPGAEPRDFNRKRMRDKVSRVIILCPTSEGVWLSIDHDDDVPIKDPYDPRYSHQQLQERNQ